MNREKVQYEQLLSTLPRERILDADELIRDLLRSNVDAIIVVDDDPTGAQTVYDVPVLTVWDQGSIERELKNEVPLFFILTNSRSLEAERADDLAMLIGRNIRIASEKLNKRCWVISRSDSTLRGHYPGEVLALEAGLEAREGIHFLIPAFFEGGRMTINDIHYVKEGDDLIPVGDTPYAQDKVFGFRSSNLTEWVQEKTNGAIRSDEVQSISLTELRSENLEKLVQKITDFQPKTRCIVNAVNYGDLKILLMVLLKSGVYPIFRTAASFISSLHLREKKTLLDGKDIHRANDHGGLIIVGSYVPKSSQQLKHLLDSLPDLISIEIDVFTIINQGSELSNTEIARVVDDHVQQGKTVVLFTSRGLLKANTNHANQQIGQRISDYLSQIVRKFNIRPAYILTKGGITSSDIATDSLGVKRAMVQGQIIDGVPVWKLGPETKFPGMSLIIFPGNVGPIDGVTQVIRKLR